MAKHFQSDTDTSLNTSLVSYWNLNESSGDRADFFGSITLTNINSVGSVAGKVHNAAVFVVASSQYLIHLDNAALSTGDIDFSFAAWVYLTNKTTDQYFIVKATDVNNYEYIVLYLQSIDRFFFGVTSGGTPVTAAGVAATTFGSPSAGTWYFIVASHDSVNNLLEIQVNNGTINSAAFSAGVFDGPNPFTLGSLSAVRLDEIGFWKKRLSTQERTDLYHSGTGQTMVDTVSQTVAADTDVQITGIIQTITTDIDIIFAAGTANINSDSEVINRATQQIEADTEIFSNRRTKEFFVK